MTKMKEGHFGRLQFRTPLKFDRPLPHRVQEDPMSVDPVEMSPAEMVPEKMVPPEITTVTTGPMVPMVPSIPMVPMVSFEACIGPQTLSSLKEFIVEDVQNLGPGAPRFFELFDTFRMLGHAGQQEK